MVKAIGPEVRPGPPGVRTWITAEPGLSTSVPSMAADSSLALTKDVGRGAPFHSTSEVASKSLPLTVSVSGPLAATTLSGEIEARLGTWMADHVPPMLMVGGA